MKQPMVWFLVLAVASAGSVVAQGSWPLYQGGPDHRGFLPITIDPATVVHRFSARVTTGTALTPIVVAAGKVFAGDRYGTVAAVDTATGATAWSVPFANLDSLNPPSFADGKIWVQTCHGPQDTFLRCLDAASGQQLSQTPNHVQSGPRYNGPTIRDGFVYVPSGIYNGLQAVRADGQAAWYTDLPSFTLWTPAVDGDSCYCYVGTALCVLDKLTGVERYRIPYLNSPGNASQVQAAVLGGHDDVIVQQEGRLFRFDLERRQVAWDIAGGFVGQPTVHDGVIYVNGGTTLQARDQATGALAWTWNQAGLTGNVIVTARHLIVHTNLAVYLVDLQTHAPVWTASVGGHLAVDVNGLYVGRLDGWVEGYGFQALPTATAFEPDQLDALAPPAVVTIRGSGFSLGGALGVEFGGAPATEVQVLDDGTLTCRPPPHAPGIVDVALENGFGRLVASAAFAFTPAVALAGEGGLGTNAVISFVQPARRTLIVGCGFGPPLPAPVAVPPFGGALQIAAPEILFATPFWPSPRLDLQLAIPPDPALHGTRVVFQSLVGQYLYAGIDGAFSNCVELVIL